VFGLTPEHLERIKRIAAARKQTVEQVLCDILTEYWVRYAASERIPKGEVVVGPWDRIDYEWCMPPRVWCDYDWWTGLFDTAQEFWALNGGCWCSIVFSNSMESW